MRHRQVMAAIFLIDSSITLPHVKGLTKFLSFSPNNLATLDSETPKEFKVKRPELQETLSGRYTRDSARGGYGAGNQRHSETRFGKINEKVENV